MPRNKTTFPAIAALAASLACASAALAHGFVGDRFFPPTITSDDPFATDELALPVVSYMVNPPDDGQPQSGEVDSSFEFDKEIFKGFTLGVSDAYVWQKPTGGSALTGWDNVAILSKLELWQSEPHEAIVSVGLEADVGGTGNKSLADSFTTLSPEFLFGKGFGDLPDAAGPLRPFAVTGQLIQTFPTSAASPNEFQWQFAVEYSFPYLQEQVQEVDFLRPFRTVIPLVEFSLQTPENRGGGKTTGTVNPGVLWEFRYFQLGAEAIVPMNGASGNHIGAVFQIEIFIDDLFPRIFGHPIFGDSK
jgi:hypothetical protein